MAVLEPTGRAGMSQTVLSQFTSLKSTEFAPLLNQIAAQLGNSEAQCIAEGISFHHQHLRDSHHESTFLTMIERRSKSGDGDIVASEIAN
jgi:hypothetical protein